MESSVQESQQAIREEVRKLCRAFPDSYWQHEDKEELYPQEFTKLRIKLIPSQLETYQAW